MLRQEDFIKGVADAFEFVSRCIAFPHMLSRARLCLAAAALGLSFGR